MTDNLVPDSQADRLFDGTLDDVPHHLRRIAGVFAAAQQPPTSEELSAQHAVLRQVTEIVTTPQPTRSTSMFGTRLTRRTAAVIVATVLAGGTAAAAAGGVLSTSNPLPQDNPALTTTPGTDAPVTTAGTPGAATPAIDMVPTTDANDQTEQEGQHDDGDATQSTDQEGQQDDGDVMQSNDQEGQHGDGDGDATQSNDQEGQHDDAADNQSTDQQGQHDDGAGNQSTDQQGQHDDGN